MTRIFVSAAYSQKGEARRLGELIGLLGHEVRNAETFAAGENLADDILAAIRNSDVLICLLTDVSANVFFELGYAFGIRKPAVIVTKTTPNLSGPIGNMPTVRVDEIDEKAAFQVLAAIASLPVGITPVEKDADIVRRTLESPNNWGLMDSVEFERRVAAWFNNAGVKARFAGPGDRGFDILAHDNRTNKKYIIETKNYSAGRLASIEVVRHLVDAVAANDCDAGILITTTDFTQSAREYAKRSGVPLLLWRTRDLANWHLP